MRAIPMSRHTFNYEVDRDLETNKEPSATTPDQSLSLRDMLNRYRRGQSVPTFDPVYDGEENMPDISTMSKIELEELRMDVLGEIQYQRTAIQRRKAAQTKITAAEMKAAQESEPEPLTDPSDNVQDGSQ